MIVTDMNMTKLRVNPTLYKIVFTRKVSPNKAKPTIKSTHK